MLSWLFRRGISKHVKEELSPVNKALNKSFTKIKEDFLHIHKNLSTHHENHSKVLEKLERIEQRLSGLEDNSSGISTGPKSVSEEESIKASESEWNSLTDLQKNMLQILAKLHEEGGKEWVPLRQLTEEIYPDREYHKVRPLMSSYTSILIEYNLIKKKRVGKNLFIALNSKSLAYIQKYLKTKRLLKLLSKD